ncbi:MAG: hypothetical protein ACI8UO_000341 [Verrucomicrobiales bacterium]
MQFRDETEILGNGALRGVSRVKNVSSDEERVDLVLLNGTQQKGEKLLVLFRSREVSKRLAEVPIRAVENAVGVRSVVRDV